MARQSEFNQASEDLEQRLTDLEVTQDVVEQYNPAKQEGDTRTAIARYFVKGYFLLFVLILVGVPVYNIIVFLQTDSTDLTLNLTDLLQVFASVIGSALGFVIGYYFKSNNE